MYYNDWDKNFKKRILGYAGLGLIIMAIMVIIYLLDYFFPFL